MAEREAGEKVRLILKVQAEVVRALKVRAATETTTVSQLVTAWVHTWAKSGARQRGGRA